jgi:hypothetical protein
MRRILVALLVSACGGSDDSGSGSGGDPVTASEAASTCQTFATHASSCGWGGNVNQFDWNCGEAALVWRDDVFRAFSECATALPCSGDGTSCYQQARDAVMPLAYHGDYAAACQARVTECSLIAATCTADAFELYTGTIVTALTACYGKPCAEIQSCVNTVL